MREDEQIRRNRDRKTAEVDETEPSCRNDSEFNWRVWQKS
jgi:hypothetical protein